MSQLPHFLLFERGRPDHNAHVKAGMELGRWQPTKTQWQDWLKARRRQVSRYAPAWLFGIFATGVSGAMAIMAAGYSAGVELAVAVGCVAVPAFIISVLGLIRRQLASGLLEKLRDTEPPHIVLTSTGLLFGDLARAWNGDHTRLDHAEFDPNGPSLIVHFRTANTLATISTYEYALPMPAEVARQAADITRDINRLATSRPV